MKHRSTECSRRAAFTLMELLVVVVIIIVIMGLATGAYFHFASGQGEANTRSQMAAIHKILQSHWNEVVQKAKTESPSQMVKILAGNNDARARVIWTKVRLAEAFPMKFDEISDPWVYRQGLFFPNSPPLIPVQSKQRYIVQSYQKMLGVPGPSHQSDTQSAACLLMALSVSRGQGSLPELDRFTFDTDKDGIPELVDGWRFPLHFFRFPTVHFPTDPDRKGLQAYFPATTGRADKFRDPLDPDGTLLNLQWYNTPLGSQKAGEIYESLFHKISAQPGTPPAYYTVPVIVSSGDDAILGLQPGTMAIIPVPPGEDDPEADNIYSFEQAVKGGIGS